MVKNNFPTLEKKFETFRELPSLLLAEIKEINLGFEKTYDIEYTMIKSDSSHNIIEIKFEDSESSIFLPNMQVRTSNGIRKVEWTISFVVHQLFEKSDQLNVEMPLTNYLYRTLKKEYDDIHKKKY